MAGSVKLGHPVPESNFASELNSSLPHAAQRYIPSSFECTYLPVKGGSVPWRRITSYSSGVSCSRHSSSVFSTLASNCGLLSLKSLRCTSPPMSTATHTEPCRRRQPLARRGRGSCAGAITVERVMTDDGAAYRSTIHATVCRELGVRHLTTQPSRSRTNGKAERFIQTLLVRWAYRRPDDSGAQRTAALQPWLFHYDFTRPHGSLSHKPPGS